jgi:hypothetical protein
MSWHNHVAGLVFLSAYTRSYFINLYLIIKRQNFRLFFSSIHLFDPSPSNYRTMESFFHSDLYISRGYGVQFQNVLG